MKRKLIENDSAGKLTNEIKNVSEKMDKIEKEQIVRQALQSSGKNESTTLILAIVLGLIGLLGIGHMYVGKKGIGIGLLILGIILVVIGITTISIGLGVFLLVLYFITFIVQIFGASKSCREYNAELYRSTKYNQGSGVNCLD